MLGVNMMEKYDEVKLIRSQQVRSHLFCSVVECALSHSLPVAGDSGRQEQWHSSHSVSAHSSLPLSLPPWLGRQFEGPISAPDLVRVLLRVVEEHGAMMVAARSEAEEREHNRRLRRLRDFAISRRPWRLWDWGELSLPIHHRRSHELQILK